MAGPIGSTNAPSLTWRRRVFRCFLRSMRARLTMLEEGASYRMPLLMTKPVMQSLCGAALQRTWIICECERWHGGGRSQALQEGQIEMERKDSRRCCSLLSQPVPLLSEFLASVGCCVALSTLIRSGVMRHTRRVTWQHSPLDKHVVVVVQCVVQRDECSTATFWPTAQLIMFGVLRLTNTDLMGRLQMLVANTAYITICSMRKDSFRAKSSYECRMNEQWSCAGICVEPQSEQRSLGTSQQATVETHNLSGIDRTTPAASLSTAITPINFPNCSSSSSSSQPDCVTDATNLSNLSAVDGRILISCPTVSLNKVEEQKNNSCSYESSSSVPTDDIILSSSSETLTDETYPSTSTADTNIFDEKTTLQDCQLSRIIRRRCRFLLPSKISHKLLRIVLKQPTTLKHLNITSVKVGESDLLPVIVNDATLSLLSISYSNTSSEMNSLAGVPVGANGTDRPHVYDPFQSENNRHELTPSTSTGHAPGKRRTGIINNDMYQTAIGMHGYVAAATGQSSAATVVASVKQQQSQISNTSSPLLVNLLRSSSPVATVGMHNLQHTHLARTSATVMQHMSASSPQTQGTAGYSSYTYMGQSAMNAAVQPGRMRPSAIPVEASHLTTSTHGHSEQQQIRSASQAVSMERHQQMVAPQQQGAPTQQLPQTYYPQYNQRRPMLAGFAVRGQMPQQQPSVYAHQQGQMMPPHYIHVQQQPRLSGQPVSVHFHQTLSLEQDVNISGSPMPDPAPPTKKRKRPTKKQLKEAEIAQQAAAAAAAQQQFMLEQQMNNRVPSANAHTVDRPPTMPQVMHSGQPSVGITYAQHPQGYPPQTLRSPPAVSAQTGPIVQNSSLNSSFYQQQSVWIPQHQQQIVPQQRPQMIYGGQMQHHWQNSQSHHARMMYPQADNVSEMSGGSSGSVHTSPMTSRNASIDYSPASQSSSTMSPLYQQQQPNVVYQQLPNQQTPPSGLTYPQPSSSQQQIAVTARPQQQTMPIQIQEAQQQQPSHFSTEQHCLDMQPKSCLPVLQGGGDFEMDDELGANIADDCGDYNDLDSIEPMTESSEFGATLMASHQQQMQQRPANIQQHMQEQQQQQLCYGRMLPPQNRYDIQSPIQQQTVGYMRQMCNETQMRQCGFPSTLGLSQQQQQLLPQGYSSPQQQQQPSQVTHQQYAASPLSQQQQQSIRTPLSAPPTMHSQSQLHPVCGRIDDLRSSRSDGEVTPRTPVIDSNVASVEYDKDPINSTIDAVVMRALSDQDSLSSTSVSNYFRGSRNRLSANTQLSTAEQTGSNDRGKVMGNNLTTSMRPVNTTKQPGQFQNSQQTQQLSNTDDSLMEGGLGITSSHNGQTTGNSTLSPNKMPVSIQQLASASRENLHGVTCGGNNEMHSLSLSGRQQKDQRISDGIVDQRQNNIVEQRHLTNGHESLNMLKEREFAQPYNGMLPLSQSNDDERRLTGGLTSMVTAADLQQPQRSSPKTTGTIRRNRRKADLSLEVLSYDDEDEITVPTFGTTQSAYQAPYMRRVSGPSSIVVGCSGSAPVQPPFANISVQSAQNNFSATVARQQQMLKQQPKTS
ncbi:Tonsoku-like protein [Dirofilaria immitis]